MVVDSILRSKHSSFGSIVDFEKWMAKKLNTSNSQSKLLPVYTIPVVFHVIHAGNPIGVGGVNLSQNQINSQITVLNEDFRKITGSNGDNNDPNGADTEIEFCLALTDELGNVLSEPGINRINGPNQGWGSLPYSTGLIDQFIKPATQWDPEKYMNVWITEIQGGVLGYAQFPEASGLSGLPNNPQVANTDGVVLNYYTVGAFPNNPFNSPYNLGRTASHEIGHFLGLRHIWGDGTCSVDDYCSDTPLCSGPYQSSGPSCNSVIQCGNARMIENYMDYSDDQCMNIFTNDQKNRMRVVLQNSPRRVGLTNSTVCAITSPTLTCNFSQSTDTIYGSALVNFTDQTNGNPTNWTWSFPGANPSSSSNQNPTSINYGTTGTYTVTLQAWNNSDTCTSTSTVVVLDQCANGPILTGGIANDVTCFGDCDGSITISGSSGVPVVFNWSNGATTQNISNLCPGIYSVTVSDATTLNCFDTATYIISQPSQVQISTSGTNETSVGAGDGTASATVSGGVGTYDYLWSNAGTTSFINNLNPGTYFIAVQDANGCSVNDSVVIGSDTINVINCNFSLSSTSVLQGDSVLISNQSTGNNSGWNWIIQGGSPTNSSNQNPGYITYANPGTYLIELIAFQGLDTCYHVDTVVVLSNQNPCNGVSLILGGNVTDASCGAACDGSIDLQVSASTINFNWSDGSTAEDIGSLCPGTYSVFVNDSAGCQDSANYVISTGLVNLIDSIDITDVKCPGQCSGAVDLVSTGSIFQWSNGSATEDITNLCVGNYSVIVTDSFGCQDSTSVTITATSLPIILSLSSTDETFAGTSDGTATVNTSGGTFPLSFTWSNNATTTTITGLSSAYYSVVAVDSFGCSAYDSVFVDVQGASCHYEIQDPNPTCPGDTFCVWLDAVQNVSNGIVGMDYCLDYDPAVMTPTGNSQIGSVVYNNIGQGNGEEVLLNTNVPGQVYSAIYFNANAPQNAFWQGQGNVLCIEFSLNANANPGTYALSACELDEAYSLVEIPKCADPGQVDINTSTVGKIVYWDYDSLMNGPERPLQYDPSNPGSYLITNVMAANDSTIISNTDLNGEFTWNPTVDDSIRIVRDIEGTYGDTGVSCSDVFLFINGADAYTAALISNYDLNNLLDSVNPWNPNPFQMIAGDVNINDKVRANDITLIQSRSVRSICEFPQNWNYTGGSPSNPLPGPAAPPSKDWRFLEMEMVYDSTHALFPEYQIDGNYPVYSGGNASSGYWRDDVPTVPELLSAANDDTTSICPQGVNKTYYSVLLGDLTGSWDPSNLNTANVRTTGESIIFDVYPTIPNHYVIEVSYEGNHWSKALDFKLDYNQSKISVQNITDESSNLIDCTKDWNNFENDKIYFSSYSISGFRSNKHLFTIEFTSNGSITPTDFANSVSLVNGKVGGSIINIHGTTGLIQTDIQDAYVNVYPNPASDLLNLEFALNTDELVEITLLNSLGESIYSAMRPSNNKLQMMNLDISELAKGVYYLKVSTSDQKAIKRIIVQ
jgi:PKD repeat protein